MNNDPENWNTVVNWKKEFLRVQESFVFETTRTSKLTVVLQEFIAEHQTVHELGPWSRGCKLCGLVAKAQTLIREPINKFTNKNKKA